MKQPPSPMDRIADLEEENTRLRAQIAAAGAMMARHSGHSAAMRKDVRLWRLMGRIRRGLAR